MHVDLLFTDVVMPGPVRGPELAQQAKALQPDLEVLFTSGYTENAIVHEGRLDPGVHLLSKPHRREELARKLRHLLRHRQQRIAAREVLAAGVKAAETESAQAPATTQSPRILLVEDDEDIRESACELLEYLGYGVWATSSAEEAQEALAAGCFDVLFTDVSLPGRSGVELAREAVRQCPEMGVIIASGHGSAVATGGGDLAKAVLLPKPYAFSQIQSALEQVSASP